MLRVSAAFSMTRAGREKPRAGTLHPYRPATQFGWLQIEDNDLRQLSPLGRPFCGSQEEVKPHTSPGNLLCLLRRSPTGEAKLAERMNA